MRITLSSASVLVLAATLALAAPPPAALAGGPEPGEAAPDLFVKDWVNGGPVEVQDCQGSVLVILFMQTNAPDMWKYLQAYVNMLNSFKAKGLVLCAVSRENADALRNWLDEHPLNFPLATDDGSWKGNYGIEGYPFAYIVDIYGEVAWKGNGNRIEWVMPQVERCLKEVKRVTVKREDTGKSFDKVWRALDRNEYVNAIKFLQGLQKSKDEEDLKDAEALLGDLAAIADARIARAAELEKRKDYATGETILRTTERTFAGLPQAKKAREMLETWMKTPAIRAELDAQKYFEQGRVFENGKHYKRAAEMYRAAMGFPGTRAAVKAAGYLGDLIKKGFVKA